MKTDNELIAEFDGHVLLDDGWVSLNGTSNHIHHSSLDYHYSWNALMPVVRKCRDLQQGPWNDMTRLMYNPIHLALGDLDIKKIHQNVIEFIAWYNSQNQ